jgi:hypothetical protein
MTLLSEIRVIHRPIQIIVVLFRIIVSIVRVIAVINRAAILLHTDVGFECVKV